MFYDKSKIIKMEKTTTTILPGELSYKDLETMEPDTVFAHGTIPNSPEGVYMTSSNIGKQLMWCAVRRGAPDWCIYIFWAESGLDFVKSNGDKVTNKDNIKMLVPCSDEAMKWYAL
jgi:hypothetical protein